MGQTSFKVERTFAGIARYVGKAKTHTQHLLAQLYEYHGKLCANSLQSGRQYLVLLQPFGIVDELKLQKCGLHDSFLKYIKIFT